jgi:hypothetical protein
MITFTKADAPTETELPEDEKPETTYEYACETCGTELHYGGRGRKPRFCDAHKKNAPKNGTGSRSKGQAVALAAQATDLIINVTDVLQVGAFMAGYTDTAEAIDDKQPLLRERVYAALLANPARSRSIIKILGGTTDLGLAIALGTFATNIGAVAWNEYKEKRDESR